jgi:hypothetical protein
VQKILTTWLSDAKRVKDRRPIEEAFLAYNEPS